METRKTKAKVLVSVLALVGLVVLLPADVAALEGPVDIPPLGVSVVDSDPGGPDDKEQWGRVGGRTFGFTVYQVSEYDQLKWRPVNVGMAFDGAINAAGEILTLDFTGVGTAVWIGETEVEVLDENTNTYETVTVNTEFILTVKDGNDSLVSFDLMGGIPTVDIKTLTPNAADEVLFTATLEMRAQMPWYDSITAICPYAAPTVGDYLPALDVFDCLHTNPAYVRPAITMFDAGFFYEIPFLTLFEHDAHMEELVGGVQTTVDDIYGWTDFLYNDWPGRMSDIYTAHTQIEDGIADIGGRLDGQDYVHIEIIDNLAGIGVTLSNQDVTLSNQDVTLSDMFMTVGEINTKVDSCGQSEEVLNKLDDIDEGVSKASDFTLLMFGLPFIEDEELQGLFPMIEEMSPLYQKLNFLTGTLTEVNDNTNANTQSISEVLSQSQQNAQTLTQISSQSQEYADIITSLTSQLEAANQQIVDLTADMGSMYTQEELDEAIADASPGNSEYPGQGPPEKNK